MSLDLEDLASIIRDDSDELHGNVLGHHVQDEVEGERVLLVRRDGDVVADGRQVTDNGRMGRRIVRQWLGGQEHASNEGDSNGAIFVVFDLNQGLCRPAIDQLDTEDVRLREGCLDVGM